MSSKHRVTRSADRIETGLGISRKSDRLVSYLDNFCLDRDRVFNRNLDIISWRNGLNGWAGSVSLSEYNKLPAHDFDRPSRNSYPLLASVIKPFPFGTNDFFTIRRSIWPGADTAPYKTELLRVDIDEFDLEDESNISNGGKVLAATNQSELQIPFPREVDHVLLREYAIILNAFADKFGQSKLQFPPDSAHLAS